jgi:hypothetical protein
MNCFRHRKDAAVGLCRACGWAVLTYPGTPGGGWFGAVGTMLVLFGIIRLGRSQRFPVIS